MLKNCNDDYLLNIKHIDKKYVFVYQVWKELTYKKTLDTYQYRSMNSINSIQEVIGVIDDCLNGFDHYNNNINACKKEALSIIKSDEIIKKYFPILFNRLCAHLSSKTEDDNSKRVLRRQLVYCYGIIQEDYLKFIFADLKEDIDNANNPAIIKKLNAIISVCVSAGWSEKALFSVIDTLNDSSNNEKKWDLFQRKLVSLDKMNYIIIAPLRIQQKAGNIDVEDELKNYDILICSQEELLSKYKLEGLSEKNKYIVITQEAYDFYSASNHALQQLANILNTFSFFNIIEPVTFNDYNWYVINQLNQNCKHLRIRDIYSTYNFLEGAHKYYNCTKSIFTSLEGESFDGVKNKLRASFSYANMGKASYTQEEILFNYWVALESLCRSDAFESIISNIVETVPAALCHRYIYTLIRNFYEDCKRCEIDLSFSSFSLVEEENKHKIVAKMIEVFKSEDLFLELLLLCNKNSLLVYRANEYRLLFSDLQYVCQKVENHYQHVSLQLQRLYRLRNKIAHSAYSQDGSLIRFIEHLESYLEELVAEIIMRSFNSNQTEMPVVLELIRENYRSFSELVGIRKKKPVDNLLYQFFMFGEINLLKEK